MKVLIVGSSGFLGQHITNWLAGKFELLLPSKSELKDLKRLYSGADCIIHLAGSAHFRGIDNSNHNNSDLDLTNNLLLMATELNVKRFIYMSSIKAGGEFTEPGEPLVEGRDKIVCSNYGLNKRLQETIVCEYCSKNDIDFVIIRPPLVYGENIKGNLRWLVRLLRLRWPFFIGSDNNLRSLVHADNLSSLVEVCLRHPVEINRKLYVSDNFDVSSRRLIHDIASANGKRIFWIDIDKPFMRKLFRMLGFGYVVDRVSTSLQVDISKTMVTLKWEPVVRYVDGVKSIRLDTKRH